MSDYFGPHIPGKNYALGKRILVGKSELEDIEAKVREHPEDITILGIYAGILDKLNPMKADAIREKIKKLRTERQ